MVGQIFKEFAAAQEKLSLVKDYTLLLSSLARYKKNDTRRYPAHTLGKQGFDPT
jgi:hypothetical protein